MVYYFLCFWTLQKVNIPFEPFFHKKGKELKGSFPRIDSMRKKKCRTIFTNGTADNKKNKDQIINTRKLSRFPVAEELLQKSMNNIHQLMSRNGYPHGCLHAHKYIKVFINVYRFGIYF